MTDTRPDAGALVTALKKIQEENGYTRDQMKAAIEAVFAVPVLATNAAPAWSRGPAIQKIKQP